MFIALYNLIVLNCHLESIHLLKCLEFLSWSAGEYTVQGGSKY